MVSVLADHDGHAQTAGDQQRLVTELSGFSRLINQADTFAFATIATGKHVKRNLSLLEQFAQQQHKRRLARAPGRNAAHADNRASQLRRKEAGAVDQIAKISNRSVGEGERIHGARRSAGRDSSTSGLTPSNCSSASAVRAVAPACDSNVWRARWPRAPRISASLSNARRHCAICSASGMTTTTASVWRKI